MPRSTLKHHITLKPLKSMGASSERKSRIFGSSYLGSLSVESNSVNTITWRMILNGDKRKGYETIEVELPVYFEKS